MRHIQGTGVCRVFLGKPEGKWPLGRLGLVWDDNIKMGLQEVGWGDIDWMDMAQDRDRWWVLGNAAMKLDFMKFWGEGDFLTS
jgi:hypothetical protein